MIGLNKDEILKNISISKDKKVGYVSIVGRPNVGKSTFINTLIGEKVSIVSNIPQTTRKKVLGIYNDTDTQIVFLDTPGIHIENKIFNEEINKQAIGTLKDSDVILYFIDTSRNLGEEEKHIKGLVTNLNKPLIKVYTKLDLPSKFQIPKSTGIVKISSNTKEGFDELLGKIRGFLNVGPLFFPEYYYTSQDIYFRISEIIREKVFLNTKEELPHSVFIEVFEVDNKEDIMNIIAYIYTESDSQKYIVIGKGGKLVTKIGTESRIELESIFGKKVFLTLRVKTKPKWRKNENFVKKLLS